MKFIRSFLQVLLATLREIFDENAYQRFLVLTGRTPCRESYKAFMQDREAHIMQKPRCC